MPLQSDSVATPTINRPRLPKHAPRVVAVDARSLTQTGKGVPRFLAETLRELASQDALKLILFSNRPLHPGHALPPIETVIDTTWARVPGSLWVMARLNTLALQAGADTIWGPAHLLPRRRADLRSVLTVHDLVHRIMPESMGTWNRRIAKWLVEPSIHRADRIVTVSVATRDDVLLLVQPARRDIDVVYLGTRTLSPNEVAITRTKITPDAPYLFSLGSIEPRKNIDGLLRCFKRLQTHCPTLSLRLTGAHSWGASATLAAIERNDACHLLGFLSDTELAAQMAGARAFIMPSHYEGFGLPVIEAIGLAPIIAADIPVFRELGQFIDGIHFVDFTDPDAAAADIAAFLATNPTPAKFVNGGSELFQWRTTARRYAEIFLADCAPLHP
ncbi:glycosyltransferase family 4 protein [Sphingomonas hankookensis]